MFEVCFCKSSSSRCSNHDKSRVNVTEIWLKVVALFDSMVDLHRMHCFVPSVSNTSWYSCALIVGQLARELYEQAGFITPPRPLSTKAMTAKLEVCSTSFQGWRIRPCQFIFQLMPASQGGINMLLPCLRFPHHKYDIRNSLSVYVCAYQNGVMKWPVPLWSCGHQGSVRKLLISL